MGRVYCSREQRFSPGGSALAAPAAIAANARPLWTRRLDGSRPETAWPASPGWGMRAMLYD
jgi:hypothetical protein